MANMLYNGVELPDIEAVWDKETYPYYGIAYYATDNKHLVMFLSTTFSVNPENGYLIADGSGVRKLYSVQDGVWKVDTSFVMSEEYDTGEPLGTTSILVVISANHDILNTDGTVYLAASDPVDPNAGSHVTESSGDGFALYNGVKLPNIDTVWTDKVTYPYAAIALIQGQSRVLALWSMQASVTDTNLVYPVGMQTALYANTGSSWILSETESFPDGSSAALLTIFSAEWCSYDLMNTTSNTVYVAASDPIPLDGMTVIEWDGDTTGLTQQGYYYHLSDIEYFEPTSAISVETITDSSGNVSYGVQSDFIVETYDTYNLWALPGYYGDSVLCYPDITSIGLEHGLYGNKDGLNNTSWYTSLIAYTPAPTNEEEETAVVTETSGDGFALYNGVKAPSLPNYDKTKYPYAVLSREDGSNMGEQFAGQSIWFFVATSVKGSVTADGTYRVEGAHSCLDCIMFESQEAADAFSQLTGRTYVVGEWDILAFDKTDTDSGDYIIDNEWIWSSYEVLDSNNAVFFSPSNPISLDGYTVIEWNGVKNGLDWSNDNYAEIAPHAPAVNAVAVLNKGGVLTVSTDFSVNEYSVWGVLDSDGAVIVGPVNPTDNIRVYGGSDGYVSLLAYTDTVSDLKPVYLRINGAWVKQTAYERQNGEWVLISTAEKTEETATMLYNGVELPDIEAVWDKETYPYAGIIAVEDGAFYYLYLLDSESYIGADGYIWSGVGKFAFYGCFTDEELAESNGLNAGEWIYATDGSSDSGESISSSVPFWSNHNILNTDGSIYLLATDPVPVT